LRDGITILPADTQAKERLPAKLKLKNGKRGRARRLAARPVPGEIYSSPINGFKFLFPGRRGVPIAMTGGGRRN